MKLPRDIGGKELTHYLEKYGYRVTRQSGSHLRLTSNLMGNEHHITIPVHRPIKIGTISSIISSVATYLERDRRNLINELLQ